MLALVHDVAETIVGDVTPLDTAVSHEEKEKREAEAMTRIRTLVSPWSRDGGRELYDAWREYEDGKTEEAKLVKDMDKVELMLQTAEIENVGEWGFGGGGDDGGSSSSESKNSSRKPSLSDFYTLALTRLKTKTGRDWADEVMRRRPEGKGEGGGGGGGGGGSGEKKSKSGGGWTEASERLSKALEGTAPMVLPDLGRVSLADLTRSSSPSSRRPHNLRAP